MTDGITIEMRDPPVTDEVGPHGNALGDFRVFSHGSAHRTPWDSGCGSDTPKSRR